MSWLLSTNTYFFNYEEFPAMPDVAMFLILGLMKGMIIEVLVSLTYTATGLDAGRDDGRYLFAR